MPKINVYLPDDLAEAVRESGLPVSQICQQALEAAVRKVNAIKDSANIDLTEDDPISRLERFTEKSRTAMRSALQFAKESDQTVVGTRHVLTGILDEGSNLAIQVLRSMELEPDDLLEDLAARTGTEPAATGGSEHGRRFSAPLSAAMKAALSEAIAMGHNYIGCEHLLLGLVAEPEGIAGELLRSRGVEPAAAKRAVRTLLTGFSYAKNQSQQQQNPAEVMKAVLAPITERLDRLEQRLTALEG
ncbi:MAG TPA: Clp protease N-terminal domain-containing protein [Pseudonocardiaceae bacterium]|nr:Clp protease N-terminal domain-containing protein [Pseudonocardiaceae bacterium]